MCVHTPSIKGFKEFLLAVDVCVLWNLRDSDGSVRWQVHVLAIVYKLERNGMKTSRLCPENVIWTEITHVMLVNELWWCWEADCVIQ